MQSFIIRFWFHVIVIAFATAACSTPTNLAGDRRRTVMDHEELARSEEQAAQSAKPSQAAVLREQANQHRVSAAALRERGRKLCTGITDADGDAALFRPEVVESVEPFHVVLQRGKGIARRLRGAQIALRPAPGVTRAWLGRLARCHSARHATKLLPDREEDPLAVGLPEVTVVETETGFVVTISSAQDEEAHEILRRAVRTSAQAEILRLARTMDRGS